MLIEPCESRINRILLLFLWRKIEYWKYIMGLVCISCKYIYIYGYWGITVPPGTGLFICFDSFNSPVPIQTCTHFNIYIYKNKNTTILKAWIQKTSQTLQSFLDSRFKILRETFWIPSLASGWGKSERMILIQKVSPRILNLESRKLCKVFWIQDSRFWGKLFESQALGLDEGSLKG